jgi:integrase/recombinase XerC
MITQPSLLHAFDDTPPVLETALAAFVRELVGKNRSAATCRAYHSDISQFISFVQETNLRGTTPADVTRFDITGFLTCLSERQLSGVSRARKLASLRAFFRFLVESGVLVKSPVAGVETPRRERQTRTFLVPEEYTRLLALAGGQPRDYAILQVFLQTGVRVSELCNLRLGDVDLQSGMLRVTAGKGMKAREIALEKKGVQALKSYLATRPAVLYDHIFLNYAGEPISTRGVRKLVTKYRVRAGISKKASCHSLRHTFASYKAERGVSVFQLQEWLGHEHINTTQIYVHSRRQQAKKVMEATSL